ncbi:unnamed protein product [Gadus morhua 'NCC']
MVPQYHQLMEAHSLLVSEPRRGATSWSLRRSVASQTPSHCSVSGYLGSESLTPLPSEAQGQARVQSRTQQQGHQALSLYELALDTAPEPALDTLSLYELALDTLSLYELALDTRP